MKKIVEGGSQCDDPIRSIVLAPWGEILLVWRFMKPRWLDTPVQVPAESADEIIEPTMEAYTNGIELYKIDITDQKLVKISSSELHDHALFLGFSSPMLLSTKEFPTLKPNCAYITDESSEHICINMYGCRDVGIWNFETETLEHLGVVQSDHSWLNWPPPIWITPPCTSKVDIYEPRLDRQIWLH
uniref:KIB1-4 beta-propeller domain-containing protein n=1 Tax=Arundo donax TaxID=35708 RepID=A0A0A8YVV2_ARUDO